MDAHSIQPVHTAFMSPPGVESVPLDRDSFADAMAFIDAAVGLPSFASAALDQCIDAGADGTVTLDAFNTVTLTLRNVEAALTASRALRDALEIWCFLSRGTSMTPDRNTLQLWMRAFPPIERPLAPSQLSLSLDVPTLLELGYIAPIDVAVALTVAHDQALVRSVTARALWRDTQSVSVVQIDLEPHTPTEVRDTLARWASSNTRSVNAVWSTRNAVHYIDVWNDSEPSPHWKPNNTTSS